MYQHPTDHYCVPHINHYNVYPSTHGKCARDQVLINQRADVEVLWETWSSPEIDSYEDLKKNIESRKEDWYDTLDSPSTLLITVGLFF